MGLPWPALGAVGVVRARYGCGWCFHLCGSVLAFGWPELGHLQLAFASEEGGVVVVVVVEHVAPSSIGRNGACLEKKLLRVLPALYFSILYIAEAPS